MTRRHQELVRQLVPADFVVLEATGGLETPAPAHRWLQGSQWRYALSLEERSAGTKRRARKRTKKEMTFRHTVALALVGWYLLLPPAGTDGRVPNTNAPLSAWHQDGAFHRSAACMKKRKARLNLSRQQVATLEQQNAKEMKSHVYTSEPVARDYMSEPAVRTFAAQMQASRCISTDDPRLKKN
jgi:hypothetical protein